MGAVVLYLDFSSEHQFGGGMREVSALNLVKLGVWLGNKKFEGDFFFPPHNILFSLNVCSQSCVFLKDTESIKLFQGSYFKLL